ncbi:DMT family transporter [Synergistaceae bacterium OttesenSCG-928-D05]|nr:DMT family transporter [Synergistaceae bacterium OttesenSCG-928-D05]
MDVKKRSLLEIHISVLLFGLTGLFGRYLDMPAVFITLGRVFFASIFLFCFYKLKRADLRLASFWDYLTVAAAGGILAFHWTAFYQSVKVSTVAIAVLTFSTYPIFVTFSEPFLFGEKIKIRDIFFAFLMFAGVLLIVPEFNLSNQMTLGILWGMGSSFSYAVMSLLNRKFAQKYQGGVIALYEQGVATLVLLPILLVARPVVTPMEWGLLILLGIVFTGTAHSLFINGMKNVRAQTAGLIAGLESVYGIAAAALLLGEIPTAGELIGGAVILGTAFLSTWYSSRE